MSDASLQRLRALAAVWDDPARTHPRNPFNSEFFLDLERLNRFEEEFPGKSSDMLVAMLEWKVLRKLSGLYSEREMQLVRSRLAPQDPEQARMA